jgi:hypothetical protein
MNTSARVLNILIRICGVGALALGIAFWFGYAGSFIQLHISLGIVLVVSLWALAGIAWRNGVRRDLISFAGAWGIVSWVLGVTPGQILPGGSHWVVEVGHLAVGAIAIAIGGAEPSILYATARRCCRFSSNRVASQSRSSIANEIVDTKGPTTRESASLDTPTDLTWGSRLPVPQSSREHGRAAAVHPR